jgi:hypothetical protein
MKLPRETTERDAFPLSPVGYVERVRHPHVARRLPVRSLNIPHENFREGFIVGFQLIHGLKVTVTEQIVPTHLDAPTGISPFLLGVKAGIRAAGGEILGHDGQPS